MKIIGANVTGSFILNSQDVTTTIQTSNVWSGSVATDITALNASTASLNRATASLLNYTASTNGAISDILLETASINLFSASLLSYTASTTTAIADILLETASFNAFSSSILNYTTSINAAIADILLETASFNAFSASILNYTASTNGAISDILLETASINTFTSSIGGRVSIIEGKYVTTGSNTFFGTQTITGSLFIANDLVVQGTSSVQNITASAVSIGTNTVILNTDTPAVRFGGIKVQDSGSGAGASGSLLWDSLNNHWIYQHPTGGAESGMSARLISGPKNSGSLGNEAGITSGKITVAVGDDHIGDSIMTQTGTVISVAGDLTATSLTGSINGSQITNSTVANAKLANSTISGIALGSNLAALTIGTGLSGTSYNGSTGVTIANTGVTSNVAGTGITVSGATGAVTITNSGVTSIVAGTNISISGGTGAVTITNGVTNNNQLTNGAGYITSAGNAATATTATNVASPDGDRNPSTKLPTTNARNVRFDFSGAGAVGGTGNYAGVMTYAPWDGTTASTGDSSYQLAFLNETGVNASGVPGLSIRNGIDSTWKSWYRIITSGNIGSQTVATATNLSSGQTNWVGTGVLSNVIGLLAWKNYGNNHVIFDASNGTSPSGGSVSQTNATNAWQASFPTLMGWNGGGTYGVRVDSARISDSTSGNAATVTNGVYTNSSIQNLSGVLNFGVNNATPYNNPTGTSNGISFGGIEASSLRQYGIFTEQENVGGNYSKLTFNYHTGVRIGANASYGGTRFYNDAAGNGSSTVVFSVGNGDGNVRATNDVIAYASDRRLKHNIQPIENALSKVVSLTGMTYQWNEVGSQHGWEADTEIREAGVFAQDVQAVLPEAVRLAPFDDNMGVSKSGENFLTVKYEKIVPLLIEAIKEQQTQIEELKAKLG